MDNLKQLTKDEEAQHGFTLELETNADVFIKEDGTITSSFKPLHFPNIVLSTTPLDKFSPQELLKVNNAFLRHLIELLSDQLNNSEFCMTNRDVLELLEGQTEEKTLHSKTETTPPLTTEDITETEKNIKALSTFYEITNPQLSTKLRNFVTNELHKIKTEIDKPLKKERTQEAKERFNLLLERATTATDVLMIIQALETIDSLVYPGFEWNYDAIEAIYKP